MSISEFNNLCINDKADFIWPSCVYLTSRLDEDCIVIQDIDSSKVIKINTLLIHGVPKVGPYLLKKLPVF